MSMLMRGHPNHYGLVGFSGMFAHSDDTCRLLPRVAL
ncbi:hypothetical protein TIFTF001_039652 [Ficus carica]|uniref:Uncharacterized protein n=1 Tax=Ficus carica TaxID=3494 RepID=A0AA88JBA5_FICCA|nr:hypothetical protein TIFTF001_039652 [Ficus carica]